MEKPRRNSETYQIWYLANRDRIVEANRLRRAANRTSLNAARREYYAKNRVTILALAKANRVMCLHCNRDYCQPYLRDHIERRHTNAKVPVLLYPVT
jgi:hypothetical protein